MSTPALSPALRPSPLDVGGVVSGTFEIYKRRFGLFVLLAVLPMAVVFVLLALLMVPVVALIAQIGRNGDAAGAAGLIIALVLGYLALIVVGALAQIKFGAMTNLATSEVAAGNRPTLGSLWAGSRGVVGRIVGLILLGVGAALVLTIVFGGLVFALVGSAAADSSAATGLAVLLFLGLGFGLFVASILLAVRWLYVMPVIAIERASGLGALRRSWELTRNHFARTLGFAIVGWLIVYAASAVGSGLITVMPFGTASLDSASSTSELATALATMLPLFLLSMAVSFAIQIFTIPFQAIYTTVMYIDQVLRNTQPAPVGQFGYYPGQQGAAGLAAYPGTPTFPGVQQYPGTQKYPSVQQYPGTQQYPGAQAYPGAQPYPGPQQSAGFPAQPWTQNAQGAQRPPAAPAWPTVPSPAPWPVVASTPTTPDETNATRPIDLSPWQGEEATRPIDPSPWQSDDANPTRPIDPSPWQSDDDFRDPNRPRE